MVSKATNIFIFSKIFDAPRELVYKAWTETDLVERWICPTDFNVTFCQGELRPGGTGASNLLRRY